MTWEDRTRKAAYTSPSGRRFEFEIVRADRVFDKLTSAWNFPGVQGTYIQDLGSTDHRYPFRAIFWGDDHDLEALAFDNALREVGIGRLDHPRDGRVDVVPFGKIQFNEDLVNAANQTVVEVEFWETTIVLFPSGAADPASTTVASILDTFAASALTFSQTIDIETAVARTSLRNRFDTAVGAVRTGLLSVVSEDPTALRKFNTIADSIQGNIDTLILQPLGLAEQLNVLLRVPVEVAGAIGAKVDSYASLVDLFISAGNPDDALRETVNDFRNDELFSTGCMSAMMESTVNHEFSTRPEAIEAADKIATEFDVVNTWRELNYAGL